MKYIKAWTIDARRKQAVTIWQVPDADGERLFNSISARLHNDAGVVDYAVSISDQPLRPRPEDFRRYDNTI